jgi:predicted cupin superfamily sugar epimerase
MDLAMLEKKLNLQPHPEGGAYAEYYRSPDILPATALSTRFVGDRNTATAIYYLLRAGERSHFHRIASDEIWIHVGGGCLELFELSEATGRMQEYAIGHDVANGELLSAVIPAGNWFAARPKAQVEYCLTVCIVAPGFHFDDFSLAGRSELLARFPDHAGLIHDFTRGE